MFLSQLRGFYRTALNADAV